MKRVVLIGLDPATVDFSDPASPLTPALKIAVRQPRAGSDNYARDYERVALESAMSNVKQKQER